MADRLPDNPSKSRKVCFVTIGATASFHALIRGALAADFIARLARHDFTELIVQYGANGDELFVAARDKLNASLKSPEMAGQRGLEISGFGLDKAGLDEYFRLVKGPDQGMRQGMVVTHAGTGTVLAAMRLGLSIVVVPNEELLDNHQVELAEALAEQGYVVRGSAGHLAAAVDEVEKLRKEHQTWPPANAERSKRTGSLAQVMDEEMGFQVD